MGMYDYIEGEIICPYCKQRTVVNSQIKWITYELRKLHTYYIDEDIPCTDAIYTGASCVRTLLCDKCNNMCQFVKNHVHLYLSYI